MGNQDWSNLGDEIRNLVQSAIDSKDFQKLNETIGKTINIAMEGVNQGVSHAGEKVNEAAEKINQSVTVEKQKYQYRYQRTSMRNTWKTEKEYQERQLPRQRLFKNRNGLLGGGLALAITGYTLAIGLGISIFCVGAVGLATGILTEEMKITMYVLAPLFLGSSWMAASGSKMLGKAKRFKAYMEQLRGRSFCSIEELAARVGKSNKYVRKDLKDMIKRRMFLEGHLDRQETCLMVTHEVYDQYQMMLVQQEEQQRLAEQAAAKQEGIPEEARKIIQEGNEYLRKIKACNDAIPGDEISAKISRMELIIQKIFAQVERHPELVSDLHKFMGYYLPTTVKLLNAYEELDGQPVQGANILSSKQEIEGTLDTINEAFENLLDGFFKEAAWDISSDISVLQTMLAQEGLTDSDFQ